MRRSRRASSPAAGSRSLNAAGSIKLDGFGDSDERTGAQIIVRALEEPLRQLAYNAGLEGSVVVKVRMAADRKYAVCMLVDRQARFRTLGTAG